MNTEVANYDFHGSTVRIHVDGDTVEYCEIGRASCRERV